MSRFSSPLMVFVLVCLLLGSAHGIADEEAEVSLAGDGVRLDSSLHGLSKPGFLGHKVLDNNDGTLPLHLGDSDADFSGRRGGGRGGGMGDSFEVSASSNRNSLAHCLMINLLLSKFCMM